MIAGSFDGITTQCSKSFYSAMGNSGWTAMVQGDGFVDVVRSEENSFPPSNINVPQAYCCMLSFQPKEFYTAQTHLASIIRTFTVGALSTYHLSFWHSRLSFFYAYLPGYIMQPPPMYYSVYIDDIVVFSIVPSIYDWVQVELAPFFATSTSVNIKFEITSTEDIHLSYIGIS
jgi:hypothetical protein